MARRIALVVGVSEYGDFPQLQNAARDAETIAHVLRTVAEFDEVQALIEPTQAHLAERIEEHFTGRAPDDLVLLYFSGHGIKDERGMLYLAVRTTRRHRDGELVRSSAVACQHVHEAMHSSRSRRQVVILDCCFSGAFAEGLQAKDGGRIDLKGQLGGEGRAVLASSSSTQYSFDAAEMSLSTYTQFLVHGIASGEADLNHDGLITVDELHEYAKSHVQATRPAMSPQILPSREGYSIVVSKARQVDPFRAYAAKVREVADASGVLTRVALEVLGVQRRQLGLTVLDAQTIHDKELSPLQERATARSKLRKAVFEARRSRRIEADRSLINELRVALNLGEEDLRLLIVEPMGVQRRKVRGWLYWPERVAYGVLAGILCFGIVSAYAQWHQGFSSTPVAISPTPAERPSLPALAENSSSQQQSWWCLCYQRHTKEIVTACRKSSVECGALRQLVGRGNSEIVAGSARTGCEPVIAAHPGDVLGGRSQWVPSAKAGAWISPGGCRLREGAAG